MNTSLKVNVLRFIVQPCATYFTILSSVLLKMSFDCFLFFWVLMGGKAAMTSSHDSHTELSNNSNRTAYPLSTELLGDTNVRDLNEFNIL